MIPIEDLTDVTLAIEEVMKEYQAMKVIKWGKLSSEESYQLRKVIKWWKLSSDESYLVMKVKEVEIAKEVIRSDGWWRFACGDVYDKINKNINKIRIVQTVQNVQNSWRTVEKWRTDEN